MRKYNKVVVIIFLTAMVIAEIAIRHYLPKGIYFSMKHKERYNFEFVIGYFFSLPFIVADYVHIIKDNKNKKDNSDKLKFFGEIGLNIFIILWGIFTIINFSKKM